jgi:DNA invertase Pin-like site-specific DNA recombinase
MSQQQPKPIPVRGPGQPTKFREEYVDQIRRLCEAGVTDAQIAKFLNVDRKCFSNWQRRWPELFEARALKHNLKPPARPRLFRPEFIAQVRKLSELGVKNLEIATLLGVHRSTFDRWRHQHPAFGEAV